jgi:hypothetical protein
MKKGILLTISLLVISLILIIFDIIDIELNLYSIDSSGYILFALFMISMIFTVSSLLIILNEKKKIILIIIAIIYLIILIPLFFYMCENILLIQSIAHGIIGGSFPVSIKMCWANPLFMLISYILIGIPAWILISSALFFKIK